MSARHVRRAAWATAVATMLGTAWAQPPGADRSCGTPGTAPAPRTNDPEAEGRGSGLTGGVGLLPGSRFFPTPGEVSTGAARSAPPVPLTPSSPATVGSAPPVPVGPPALPGIPSSPAAPEEDDAGRPRVEAIQAKSEVPEERLLDIGVAVFDAGVDEEDRERLAAKGLSPELRRAEGRFVAFHLRKTLEGTGNWGAVRVLPGPGEGVDVFVSGRIAQSNGKRLALEVEAVDATGRRWLKRRYKGEADVSAYRADRIGQHDPFQEIYNRIANDLLAGRDALSAQDVVAVRRVAGLRFAAELAPVAFADYLKREGSGRYGLQRLPADGDPMVRRVSDIRERDQMLVDTLNDHYLSFYERMGMPYANWRQRSYDEQAALDKINRESTLKKILGGAAVIAGMVMSGNDSQGGRMAGDIALLGGLATLAAGSQQAQEKAMHEAALRELATQVDGEVAPLVVEVEGQQLKLTGSAEKQFTEWRDLLHRVFAIEMGLPGDPNAPVVVPGPPSL